MKITSALERQEKHPSLILKQTKGAWKLLKGQAKKDYQREYMRGYMRNKRAVKTSLRPNVKTSSIPGLIMDGNKILGVDKSSSTKSFWCDWCKMGHEIGKHIKPLPEIDADGQPIYD